MVAPSVAQVMVMALEPLFCMVGVATLLKVIVATSESVYPSFEAMALMVVWAVKSNGPPYSVPLLDEGSVVPSVV